MDSPTGEPPSHHSICITWSLYYIIIPHSKCQQYSPTESNKAFDKTVNRRLGVTFEPHSVLEELKRGPQTPSRGKEDYLKQYLEVWLPLCGIWCLFSCYLCPQFKQLMNRLDPFEEGEDSDGEAHTHRSQSTTPAPPSSLTTSQHPPPTKVQ